MSDTFSVRTEESPQICFRADIEQASSLTRRNWYIVDRPHPKERKDLDLKIAEPFNHVLDLAWHRHPDTVNNLPKVERHKRKVWLCSQRSIRAEVIFVPESRVIAVEAFSGR